MSAGGLGNAADLVEQALARTDDPRERREGLNVLQRCVKEEAETAMYRELQERRKRSPSCLSTIALTLLRG